MAIPTRIWRSGFCQGFCSRRIRRPLLRMNWPSEWLSSTRRRRHSGRARMPGPEGDKPMSKWSLSELLAGLHDDIENRLALARKSLAHPTTKGDASEEVWLEMLRKYLPQRYQVAKAHVVDSLGTFGEQIDVVVFDRQYSPFIFNYQGQSIIPAESVYAAFEAKQAINADEVSYAQGKVASVRRLHRTSLPI